MLRAMSGRCVDPLIVTGTHECNRNWAGRLNLRLGGPPAGHRKGGEGILGPMSATATDVAIEEFEQLVEIEEEAGYRLVMNLDCQ